MRILLVHNPEAGDEAHQADKLIKALRSAGHEPVYHSSKTKGNLDQALKQKLDLVLVAGGDGTVGKIARCLIGRKLPLSVLPLGTANNLARSLGFFRTPRQIIANLHNGVLRGFDVGIGRGPFGKRFVLEGVGAGLFADYMRAPKRVTGATSKAEQLRGHAKELRRRLTQQQPTEWKITLDREDYSERYLLWGAMNIRSVGPLLTLAPKARTDDGEFDFVAAREADREVLLKYLNAQAAGKRPKFPLKATRFRRMRVHWRNSPLHFDDEIWPEKRGTQPAEIELRVRPSSLRIWQDRGAAEQRRGRVAA